MMSCHKRWRSSLLYRFSTATSILINIKNKSRTAWNVHCIYSSTDLSSEVTFQFYNETFEASWQLFSSKVKKYKVEVVESWKWLKYIIKYNGGFEVTFWRGSSKTFKIDKFGNYMMPTQACCRRNSRNQILYFLPLIVFTKF